MTKKENLYGWIFHYNPYRVKWEAVHKSNYHDLFNGGEHVLRHNSRKILEDVILKHKGNISKPMNLVG